MTNLLNRLRDDHRNFARLFEAVEAELKRFAAGGRPNYELLLAAVEYLREYAECQHHPAEDLVYARLCACAPGEAERAGNLVAEHKRLEALGDNFLTLLKTVLSETTVPRDRLDAEAFAFLSAQKKHMRAEEDSFFKVAERSLLPEDWQELAKAALAAPDPLFGGKAEARYRELSRAIEALATEGGR